MPPTLKMDAVAVVVAEVVDFWELSSTAAAGGEDETVEAAAEASAAAGLAGSEGDEKNEVIEALALGFLAVATAMSAALRFNGVAIERVQRTRRSIGTVIRGLSGI